MTRRPVRGGAVLAALSVVLTLAGVPARADSGPSGGQVAAAQAAARQRAQQVAAAQAAIGRTRAVLATAAAAAELAVERYDKAMVDLAQATTAEQAAQLVLGIATGQERAAQAELNRFAVASYEGGGDVGSFTSLLSAGAPSTFLSRAATLDVIARGQHRAVADLTAARIYLRLVAEQAARAVAQRRAAAARADAARQAALGEVHRQQVALTQLVTEEQQLERLYLTAARHASALARARAAALARAAAIARAEAAARAAAAAAAAAAQQAPPSQPVAGPAAPPGQAAAIAVQWAYRELGKPYQWGAAGPDTFDCSGLTMFVYAKAGIQLLHYTGYQWNEGVHVAQSDLQPGDLVFFAYNTSDPNTIHHVGIYIGNGNMINAPQTGEVVSIAPAFNSEYIGAVRPYGA